MTSLGHSRPPGSLVLDSVCVCMCASVCVCVLNPAHVDVRVTLTAFSACLVLFAGLKAIK